MIDLHAHSTASDGTLTPSQLVSLAVSEGLSAIALTDHDTVAGLSEAASAAAAYGIPFIAGIELEVDWKPGVFHLLGLGLTHWNGRLKRRLEQVRRFRKTRNEHMIRRLRDGGIEIDYQELMGISGHDTVGRPHFAQALLNRGVVSSHQEAFDRFIGNGKKYYERKQSISVGRACGAIHAAGGLAVIAHPQTLQLGWSELQRLLHRWKHEGVDGVEAYHPNMKCTDGHRIAALAEELGLMVTAGSDFHAPGRMGRRLGRSCDGQGIDDRFLIPFEKAKQWAR